MTFTYLPCNREHEGQQDAQEQRRSVGLVRPETMGARRNPNAGNPNATDNCNWIGKTIQVNGKSVKEHCPLANGWEFADTGTLDLPSIR